MNHGWFLLGIGFGKGIVAAGNENVNAVDLIVGGWCVSSLIRVGLGCWRGGNGEGGGYDDDGVSVSGGGGWGVGGRGWNILTLFKQSQ